MATSPSFADSSFIDCVRRLKTQKGVVTLVDGSREKIPFFMRVEGDEGFFIRGSRVPGRSHNLSNKIYYIVDNRIFRSEVTEAELRKKAAEEKRLLTFRIPSPSDKIKVHDFLILDEESGSPPTLDLAPGQGVGAEIENAQWWWKNNQKKIFQVSDIPLRAKKVKELLEEGKDLSARLQRIIPQSQALVMEELGEDEEYEALRAALLRFCPITAGSPATAPHGSGG